MAFSHPASSYRRGPSASYLHSQFDPDNPYGRRIGAKRDPDGRLIPQDHLPISPEAPRTDFPNALTPRLGARVALSGRPPVGPVASPLGAYDPNDDSGAAITQPIPGQPQPGSFPKPRSYSPTLPQLNQIVAPNATSPAAIGAAYRAGYGNFPGRGTTEDTGATSFDERGNRQTQTVGSGGFPSLEYDPSQDMGREVVSANGTVTFPRIGPSGTAGVTTGGPRLPAGIAPAKGAPSSAPVLSSARGVFVDRKYQTPGASNMGVISGGTISDGRGNTYDPASGVVARSPWTPSPVATPAVPPPVAPVPPSSMVTAPASLPPQPSRNSLITSFPSVTAKGPIPPEGLSAGINGNMSAVPKKPLDSDFPSFDPSLFSADNNPWSPPAKRKATSLADSVAEGY